MSNNVCKRFNVHYYSQSVEIYCNTLSFAKPVSLHSYAKLCRQKEKYVLFRELFALKEKHIFFLYKATSEAVLTAYAKLGGAVPTAFIPL